MPHPIDVTFEVVTPAYAGGADRAKTDGLRPPTLKALLRFWWRAMHPELDSEQLFKAEEAIFGSTKAGQGIAVVPRSRSHGAETCTYKPDNKTTPLFYMAYGADRHQVAPKKWIEDERAVAGSEYSFGLVPAPSTTDAQWGEFLGAVWLLSTLGGFGRRSRRGFGSIQAASLPHGWPDVVGATDNPTLIDRIGAGLKRLGITHSSLPQHTALSKAAGNKARVLVGPGKATWENALRSSGEVFYSLRRMLGTSYDHWAKGEPVGPDFRRTTDYRKHRFPAGSPPATYGSIFGLPQNYQFTHGTGPSKVFYEVFGPKDKHAPRDHGQARRASPLFFKVLKRAGPDPYVPLVIWLPALFLPSSHSVKFNDGTTLTDVAIPTCSPHNVLLGQPPVTSIPGWLNGTPHPRPFKGYLARDGWQEVTW